MTTTTAVTNTSTNVRGSLRARLQARRNRHRTTAETIAAYPATRSAAMVVLPPRPTETTHTAPQAQASRIRDKLLSPIG